MTNKLRRSMTSVLLAASLLFSSQSVVAFADYGSKSDASDLSPVQESVENATEEQQEDPSLSVEPVIGESTEAPVAAPMMARANAPVAYSAPTPKPGYEELTAYTALAKDCQLHVYINSASAGNIDLIDSNALDEVFPEGTGFRVFESKPNSEWVFDKWETNVFLDGTIYNINESNPTGVATGVYCFSDPSNKNTPYNSESNSIRVNRVTGLCEDRWHNIYYSVYANFNPLVTVDVGENGTVTYNNTEVSHEDSGEKVEVEYGTAPNFTITPNAGYKVASVTFGDDTIPANEDGTYPLPPVTEPTTLKVTFEPDIESNKPNPGVNMDEVILTVKCATCGKIYQYNLTLKGTEGIDGDYYIDYVSGQNKAKISINNQKWLNKFDSTGNHILNDEPYSVLELSLNDDDKWTIDNNEDSEKTTIHVKCTSEILGPDESIISQLEVALNCVNVTDGSHNDTSKLSTYTTGYYTCEVDKVNRTATVSITEDQAKYWIDNNINTMVGKEQHSFVSVSDPITLTYENGQWKVPEDDNAKKIVIKMLCGPSIAQLNDQLNVKMVCDNNGVHSGNNEQFSREYDILADSYHLDMYSVGGEYRCDVTIDAPQYLSKFDQDTNATHVLMSSDNKRTLYYTEDGNWLIVPDEEKTVTFNVSCKPDINFPNPPDKETVLGLIGDVTIQCTTASSGHGQNKYSLTKDDIDFENVVPVQMTAGDEIQFTLPVTIKNAAALQSGFLANYNTLTGKTHIWSSGSIPASITLTYDSVTKTWANKDVNGIVLSVYCTTGGGTIDPNPNPGGGGDNDDDDDRYTGGNTVTRIINDDDVPLNDRPNNTTTIDDEDVPLADLPDDTVTIDDGEVPLKANPSTGDSLPFAAMAAAALSLGGVIVLNRKKK